MPAERILVVDDEAKIARLCTRVLTREGYEAHGVSSGKKAIALLEQESFDLLVLDIRMPDLDGLTVLRRGRELDPHLTAVVITGFATMDSAIEAIQSGARGFILKPFSPTELLTTVRQALAQRQLELERLRLRTQLPVLEVAHTLLVLEDRGHLSEQLCAVVARELDADQAVLLTFDRQGEKLSIAGSTGLSAEGLTRMEEAIGQQSPEEIIPEDKPGVPEALLASGQPFAQPHADLADKLVVPLRTAARTVGALLLGREAGRKPFTAADVNLLAIVGHQIATALENARLYEIIARGKREWETTFDAIAQGVALLDADLHIARANRAFARMLGTIPQAVIGQHCYEAIHSETSPPPWCPCHKALASGQPAEAEWEHPTENRIFSAAVYPMYNGEGHLQGAVHILQDITAQKRMESELIQAEKMAAVGQVAATIVHEIRNVLSGLQSGVEFLEATFAPEDSRRQSCAVLQTELDRAFRILEDIRLATHPMKLKVQDSALVPLLDEVLSRFTSQFTSRGIHLHRRFQENIPSIYLDPLRMEQAITNLIRNAWEASRDGSSVEVSVHLEEGEADPEWAIIAVADHGPGIPEEVLPHVFEPFYTTKSTGLGLGLCVARRLIEAHGGALELDSTVGEGTTAWIRLPLTHLSDTPTSASGESRAGGNPAGGG